jgi:hypothetical protein
MVDSTHSRRRSSPIPYEKFESTVDSMPEVNFSPPQNEFSVFSPTKEDRDIFWHFFNLEISTFK